MSTLRPEELVRKAVAAGYGNPAGSTPQAVKPLETTGGAEIIAQALFDAWFGDVVGIAGLADGTCTGWRPTEDGSREWLGVVQQQTGSGYICTVRTAGVCIVKMKPESTAQVGDDLGTVKNQVWLDKLSSGVACARMLGYIDTDHKFAWISLGGSGSSLTVNHHEDAKSTKVTDSTSDGYKGVGYLWHVWKVVDTVYTHELDDHSGDRLMTALGGGDIHGDGPPEGFGWAGVIGKRHKMGFGEIGGNETRGFQGVLGAEHQLDADAGTLPPAGSAVAGRINVRSWAGFNARDRYSEEYGRNVYPIRFTYCPTHSDALWWVPGGCDCMKAESGGTTGGRLCSTDILWWSGTMKADPENNPSGATHTYWQQQWTPQLACERDCDSLDYKLQVTSPPDCEISLQDVRAIVENNVKQLAGSYEDIVPFGYVECAGRVRFVTAATLFAEALSVIFRSVLQLSDTCSFMFDCIDRRISVHDAFFQTKVDGSGLRPNTPACCNPPENRKWTMHKITGGPNDGGDCEHTGCDHPGTKR